MGNAVRTKSGRALDELTIEAVLAGELTVADFRISDETLRRQADSAEAAVTASSKSGHPNSRAC